MLQRVEYILYMEKYLPRFIAPPPPLDLIVSGQINTVLSI